MTRPSRSIARFIPTVLLSIGSLTVNAADEKSPPRTVTVSGHGKVSVAPNIADISAGVFTQAATAREALSANSEHMTALQAVLKERGVAAKDVQTTQLTVQPVFSQPRQVQPGQMQPQGEFVPKVVGYQVQNMVRITARDLAKLGPLLDAVVVAGANRMYGISFRVDEADTHLDAAREKAMADARRKAELLAGAAGLAVGLPVTIHDESGPSEPPPQPMGALYAMAPAAPGSVPVAAGEQELGVTVQVVYELTTRK